MMAAVFFASAQAYEYHESGSVDEPWSGWWWPKYDGGPSGGPYMWQGGDLGGDSGPIYDLDTRYFWRPGPSRWIAQEWEYAMHRETDPSNNWWGHCWGASCAQALEPYPPTDCGALSRDDLEGLLSELYEDCAASDLTWPDNPIKSGTMWWALQRCLAPSAPLLGIMVVDFSTLRTAEGEDIVWNWPVYGYEVDYDIDPLHPDFAQGIMTLYYEDHVFNAVNAPEYAQYEFRCKMDGIGAPRRSTGWWDAIIRAPGEHPTPPDKACRPNERQIYYQQYSNPWVFAESTDIRRVIDHKTIVLDDEYMAWASPCDPPGGAWVSRPGYAGSCWAGPGAGGGDPDYSVGWWVDIAHAGLWDTYIYKTPPYGADVLDTQARVYPPGSGMMVLVDQSSPPFDVWQFVREDELDSGWGEGNCLMASWYAQPLPCKMYFDALKLEYVGGGGDGGASSSAVALKDASQRVRVTPNPVGRTARISYTVPSPGGVDIAVYDVTGRSVLRAAQGIQHAGVQTATISVAELPTGTYMARVSVNGVNSTCRFVVCR